MFKLKLNQIVGLPSAYMSGVSLSRSPKPAAATQAPAPQAKPAPDAVCRERHYLRLKEDPGFCRSHPSEIVAVKRPAASGMAPDEARRWAFLDLAQVPGRLAAVKAAQVARLRSLYLGGWL